MGSYLIDTNAIIEFLGGILPQSGSYWIQSIVDANDFSISVINQIELLSYNGTPDEMSVLTDFINFSTIIGLTEDVVNKTIELRRQFRIKLPDAVIAATALLHNLTVITRNESDFNHIDGLNVINPHSI
jgi:predicted nucleic acid-binding protein